MLKISAIPRWTQLRISKESCSYTQSVIIHLCIYSINRCPLNASINMLGTPIYDVSHKSKNNFVKSIIIFPYLWETIFQMVYTELWPLLCLFGCLPGFVCLFRFWNRWQKLICKESVLLSKQTCLIGVQFIYH